MKETLGDQIKSILDNGRKWIKLEFEYTRLTVAEKTTVLLSTLIFGAVCLLLGMLILTLLAFALVFTFKDFMSPSMACLCVSGVILLLIILLFAFRRPLLENPISRLISKLILDLKPENENE